MRSRFLILFVAACAFGLALMWLNQPQLTDLDSRMVEGRWAVQQVDGQTVAMEPSTTAGPYVELANGSILGDLGRSGFSGTYTLSSNRLVVTNRSDDGPGVPSEPGPDDGMEAQSLLAEVLGANDEFEVYLDEELMIWVADSHEVVFGP